MKKYKLLILTFLFMLFLNIDVKAAPINKSFESDELYKCVIDAFNNTYKTSHDYQTYNMSDQELAAIKSLSCTYTELGSTKGIEKLTGLTSLKLDGDNISSIDITKLKELTYLSIWNNNLETIDLTQNTKLVTLDIRNNYITNFDLSKNTELKTLYMGRDTCCDGKITSLDISNNKKLKDFSIDSFGLTTLDTTYNTELESIYVYGKDIAIDLTHNNKLYSIWLNNISTLNLGSKPLLQTFRLEVDNEITSLDLSDSPYLSWVRIYNGTLENITFGDTTSLNYLQIYRNNLKSIDLSKHPHLHELDLEDNELESINLTSNTELYKLNLRYNKIEKINLTKNKSLNQLNIGSNKLTSIDLSRNTSLTKVELAYNNLESIKLPYNNRISLLNLTRNNLTSFDFNTIPSTSGYSVYNNPLERVYVSTALTYKLPKNTSVSNTSMQLINGTNIIVPTSERKFVLDFYDRAKGTLKDSEDNTLSYDSGRLKTGDKIVNGTDTYNIVVMGDVNKDGYTSVYDNLMLYLYLKGKVELDDISLIASDINKDGAVDSEDASKMNSILEYNQYNLSSQINFLNLRCDKNKIKVNETTTCVLEAKTEGNILAFGLKLETNLQISDFETSFKGGYKDGLINVYTDTPQTGTFEIGRFKVTFTSAGTETINLTGVTVDDGLVRHMNSNIVNSFTVEATPRLSVSYERVSDGVIVHVKSKSKLKDSKASWTLSDDLKTYSKKYTESQDFKAVFEFLNGGVESINIKFDVMSLKTTYTYNTLTNSVDVKVKSNLIFKDTKPSWNLSSDGLTYTKNFTSNQNYDTLFEDTIGDIRKVNINITKISEVDVKYINQADGSVLVKATSNVGFKNTKPSWTLSSDSKTYSKVFYKNETSSSTFEDIYGNTFKKNINVTTANYFEVEVKYARVEDKIVATVTSNKTFKNTKPSWTLSSDSKTYTKEIKENEIYQTVFESLNGYKRSITINTTNISDVEITYTKQQDGSMLVKAISTVGFKNTKTTWTLSSDSKTYSKVFKSNESYDITFTDINGVNITKRLVVTGVNYFKVTISYNKVGNVTTVVVKANHKFKNTKPSWTLSADFLTYTKEITNLTTYSTLFEDIYGNKISVKLGA